MPYTVKGGIEGANSCPYWSVSGQNITRNTLIETAIANLETSLLLELFCHC